MDHPVQRKEKGQRDRFGILRESGAALAVPPC